MLSFLGTSVLGQTVVLKENILITSQTESILDTLVNSGKFGQSLADIGDLDDDGVNDIAVGIGGHYRRDLGRRVIGGAVQILFMNQDGTIKGKATPIDSLFFNAFPADDFSKCNGSFGADIAGLGDLDGDGVEDIVVGSPEDSETNLEEGSIRIFFLNTDGSVKSYQKISSAVGGLNYTPDTGEHWGQAIDNMGDMDNDGVTDLVVGAPEFNEVFLVYLNSDGTVKGHREIANEFTSSKSQTASLGFSVSNIGDIDGNGVNDIAAGDISDKDGGVLTVTSFGAVWVALMNADGSVKKDVKHSNWFGTRIFEEDINYGMDVQGIGDINQDGIPDLAVGFYGSNGFGGFIIYYADTTGRFKDGFRFDWNDLSNPTTGAAGLGFALAPMGDRDGDGLLEIMSGVPGNYYDNSNRGGLVYMEFALTPESLFESSNGQQGCSSFTAQFQDMSSFGATSWEWDVDNDGVIDYTEQHPTHTYTSAGSYHVKLVTSNQYGKDSVIMPNFIRVDTIPQITFYNMDTMYCSNVTNKTLLYYYPGNANWDLQGNGILTDQRYFHPDSAGVGQHPIRFHVTDYNGCQSDTTVTFTVLEPVLIDAGQDFDLCMGSSLQLQVSSSGAKDYTWTPVSYLDDPNMLNPTVTLPGTGNYYFYVTASNELGCQDKDTLIINGLQAPNTNNTISASNGTSICPGYGFTSLKSNYFPSASEQFQWYHNDVPISGETESSYFVRDMGGSFYIIATNPTTGCTFKTNVIDVVLLSAPDVELTTESGSTFICDQQSLQLSVPNGYTYQWYYQSSQISGATSSTYQASQAGSYDVDVYDGTCASTVSVYLTESQSQNVNFDPLVDTICNNAAVVNLSASPSGGVFSVNGSTIGQFNPTDFGPGNYTIIYTLNDDCASSGEENITVISCTTGLEEVHASGYRVYPNQVADQLHIDGLQGMEKIKLLSADGRILNEVASQHVAEIQLDFSTLAPGSYFVVIQKDVINYVFKIIH